MSTRPRLVRKSSFIEVLSSEATDYFDLVRNGQNLRIKQSNLVSDFGVSGPLASVGETISVPILAVIAGVNYIRNAVAGPGIGLTTSPQNGLYISHNFDVNKSGVPIMINESAAQPTLRSIQAGTGITVGGAGDIIQISTSGTPGSTKTIQVFDINDFPTPSAGVITLADNTEYLLQNDVSSANRFIVGLNTVVSGADGSLITLGYTGSGVMFTAADKSWKMRDIAVNCPSGTVFDMSSSTGLHIFRYISGGITCANIGTFDDMYVTVFWNVFCYSITGTGFTFTGNHSIVLLSMMAIVVPSGTGDAVDIGTATFDSFTMSKVLFNVNSTGYCLTGSASSANINTGGLGTVMNCQQLGSATFLDGNISPYDNRWQFQMNPDVADSLDLGLATHGGGTIAIAAANTPVKIGSTWTAIQSHRINTDAAGIWAYQGKGCHAEITVSITGHAATASYTYNFYVYKNGVQVAASMATRLFSTSDGNVTLVWSEEMVATDYIEIWVENTSSTVDFVVTKAVIRIKN